MPRFIALVALFLTLALTAACNDGGGAPGALETPQLPVIEVRYDGGVIRAEVANTPETRTRGLGGRDSLAADAGMLFELEDDRIPGFWMKDMRFPLDMVWIDANKRVTDITFDARPEPGVDDDDLQRYSPGQPVRYVLELNAGAAEQLGITVGDELQFEIP